MSIQQAGDFRSQQYSGDAHELHNNVYHDSEAIGIAQPLGYSEQSGYTQQRTYATPPSTLPQGSAASADHYTQHAVSPPTENAFGDDTGSRFRQSQFRSQRQSQYPQSSYSGHYSNRQSQYSQHSQYPLLPLSNANNGYRQPSSARQSIAALSQHSRYSTYAQDRAAGISPPFTSNEPLPQQADFEGDYDSKNVYHGSDGWTDSDTKKSEVEEDVFEKEPIAVVALPRPQRHPHYYVPPVLRFYTLLIVFLIASGLIGLTEVGMQRLPQAAKAQHVDPQDLANALASKSSATASSAIQKRAPQTITTPASAVTSVKATTTQVATPTTTPKTTVVVPPSPSSESDDPPPPPSPPSTVQGTTPSSSIVQTTAQVTKTPSSSSFVTTKLSSLESSVANQLTLSSQVSTTLVTSIPSSMLTTDQNGRATTIVTLVASTSTGITAIQTTVSTGKSTEDNKKSIFTPLDTFVGNSYMVLLIAIAFKQFWSAIYSQAKLIDPFVQLNTEGGAEANRVMNLFYLSSKIVPDVITAAMNGRWFIFWNALIYMSVGLLAPLASEMLFLNTKYLDCPTLVDNIDNPCWPPRLTIDPVLARVVQGLLAFVALLTLGIMFFVHKTRTGVYADPSSIGAIATLVHHPEVLSDFRALSDEATNKDIAAFIAGKRYKLDDYLRPDGTWRYGIVPVNPTGQQGYRNIDAKKSTFDATPRSRVWKKWDMLFDGLFLICLLALLGVVAGYFATSGDNAYNRFFNTMSFGPRFVLTGTGTLIAVNWRRLERDAHTLSPFARMAQVPSEPLSTILLRKSSIPLTAVLPMLTQRYILASFISFVAVVSEVLVIFLGAVPYAPGQVYVELLVSAYTSMALLALMIIALVTFMVWKKNLPDLPRAPTTVASMITYVAESKMQEDFEMAEWCDDRELKGRLSALNKKYVYGKRASGDGEYRHLVDEEPSLVY